MLASTGLMPPTWATQRVAQLSEDADVDVAGRADRADQRHVLALEHGGVAGDAALDGLLEDDVGLVEPRLGPAGRVVVDLHRHGGPLGDAAAGGRQPGERAGGRRARSSSSWSSLGLGAASWCDRTRSRRSGPARRVRRSPARPRRAAGAPGCGSRRISPSLGVDRRGAAPQSGVIHAGALGMRGLRPKGCRRRCPRRRRRRCRPPTSCRPSCRTSWPVPARSGRRRSPWRGGSRR